MYVTCRAPQLRRCGHDGYQRRHRDVDILFCGEFHLGYYRDRIRNRLRRSETDAALVQTLLVISETIIKDVIADETGVKKLSFVYSEGPAQLRLERDIIVAAGARRSLNLVEPVRRLTGRRGTVAGPWLAYRATRAGTVRSEASILLFGGKRRLVITRKIHAKAGLGASV